ncbi:MAG: MarR family transcriptional regulator [Magnetococcales bacterium]|nr:MarR family transcriptional regulator [Magnetococcales bacterium]
MELQPIAKRFVLHWGEMGSRWGVNRSVAQIHALLYLASQPMDAEEIAETLDIARSNVSTSLKELLAWRLVRMVHRMGDRRDHFVITSTDLWELFRLIVEGRRQREIDPTIRVLRECVHSPDMAKEDPGTKKRVRETLEFIEVLTTWADGALRLPPAALMKMLGVGAIAGRVLRKK